MVWKSPPESTKLIPSASTPAVRRHRQKARSRIATGNIGLHHDVVSIGGPHAAAERQGVVGIAAARIGPDADLGAQPVGLDEVAFGSGRRRDQELSVARESRRRHRQAERRKHRAGAELVLAEREERIVGTEGRASP